VGEHLALLVQQHGEFELRIDPLRLGDLLQARDITGGQPARRRGGQGLGQRLCQLGLAFQQQGLLALGRVPDE